MSLFPIPLIIIITDHALSQMSYYVYSAISYVIVYSTNENYCNNNALINFFVLIHTIFYYSALCHGLFIMNSTVYVLLNECNNISYKFSRIWN